MGCCRSNAEFARWRLSPGRPAAGAAVLRAAAGLGALAGERKVVGGGEPEEVEVGLIVVVVAVAMSHPGCNYMASCTTLSSKLSWTPTPGSKT